MNDNEANNYLVKTDDLKKTWELFSSLFEIRKAAGGLVLNKQNQRLYIKRRGLWDLPKGHLEKGEKNRTAAIREVEEECGIKNLKIEKKLIKTYHTYTLKKAIVLKPTKWYLMSYTGTKKPVPQKKEGITEVVWADKKEENKMLTNSFSSISEVIDKANTAVSVSEPESI